MLYVYYQLKEGVNLFVDEKVWHQYYCCELFEVVVMNGCFFHKLFVFFT